ncbi:hypothetical protein PR202_ga13949 [Eleusine coracana subsp. coracana]|uniref:Uncharacterized protein n=1 Tax=Eleusine coracana subsp. coracana TaxID=191504 RepID=A0AAV5CFK6_ELECO|nr:hypothetical protein PR202_ga13949 [Eleusine coracana subsp. coracana]
MRHRAGRVGARRGGAAGVPGVGVPIHPAGAHLPGAWPTRQGLPAVAMAAARVLPTQVRRRFLPPLADDAGHTFRSVGGY